MAGSIYMHMPPEHVVPTMQSLLARQVMRQAPLEPHAKLPHVATLQQTSVFPCPPLRQVLPVTQSPPLAQLLLHVPVVSQA